MRLCSVHVNGPFIAAGYTVTGFAFFGKNIYNIWPILVGVLHGGINLYTNGFAGGFVASFLAPALEKISKIVDEILTYFLYNFDAESAISIKPSPGQYTLHFRFDGVAISDEQFENLEKRIVVNRQPELEDYYWQLAGEIEESNEMMLVGMMCDSIDPRRDGTTVLIDLVRKT